jgi:DNA-binding MarR family transcriptional regulator
LALNYNEFAVLALLAEKDTIIRKDVETALAISQTMAIRVLKGLVDKGEIQAIGQGKNTRYTKRTQPQP